MGKGIPGNLAGEVGVVARRGGAERGRGEEGDDRRASVVGERGRA